MLNSFPWQNLPTRRKHYPQSLLAPQKPDKKKITNEITQIADDHVKHMRNRKIKRKEEKVITNNPSKDMVVDSFKVFLCPSICFLTLLSPSSPPPPFPTHK